MVDLEAALAGDSVADLELEANDTLAIPRAPKTVTVIREVRQPGTHLMVPELSLDDYISLSAGLTPRADADALYIIKANGEVIMLSHGIGYVLRTIKQVLRLVIRLSHL